jgi:hypothetical protein
MSCVLKVSSLGDRDDATEKSVTQQPSAASRLALIVKAVGARHHRRTQVKKDQMDARRAIARPFHLNREGLAADYFDRLLLTAASSLSLRSASHRVGLRPTVLSRRQSTIPTRSSPTAFMICGKL